MEEASCPDHDVRGLFAPQSLPKSPQSVQQAHPSPLIFSTTQENSMSENNQNVTGSVVNITFLGTGPWPGAIHDERLIDVWNKENPNIQVTFVEGPLYSIDRLNLLVQTFQAHSSAIDAMQFDVIWPGELADHLVDLNQYRGKQAVADDLWLGSTAVQKQRALAQSLLPTKQSLYQDPEIATVLPFMPKLLPIFENAVARPSTATAPITPKFPRSSLGKWEMCWLARSMAQMPWPISRLICRTC
jgi:ABC-type glycerol-3-phosphate transport system substrate-binding protein